VKSTRGRVITEPLGGSKLSLAVQTRALPDDIQPWWPQGSAEWRAHVERRRGEVSGDWLEQMRGAFGDGEATKLLERVVNGRGVVVTTGQQPGLFGGPVYTLAKALTALELSASIERETGVPAAPVFWAATDDADFLEASVAFVADASGLRELSDTNKPDAGTPMSTAALGALSAQIDALRAASGSAAHGHYFDLAAAAYSKATTVGGAYLALMRGLLEPLGMAVFDASHDSYRSAARPILLEALKGASTVGDAIAKRAAAIRALGFVPQVEDDRGLSLTFAIEKGLKRRLSVSEAGSSPSAPLSPNVLLRPVVEREVLPTVAYVAGPGELAYFSQADAVATALGRRKLSVVPRWSCTILEPFAERALARLGVPYQELRDVAALERRLARASLPETVAQAWKRLGDQVNASVEELGKAVKESSLMPPEVVEGFSRSLAHRLGRTERRLLAAAKRRDDNTRRDIACASAALWPRGQRQERVLNFIPMLARCGDELLAEMRAKAAEHANALIGALRSAPARTG
jgi:uncharacterized protein YllA (UPF0747 family)